MQTYIYTYSFLYICIFIRLVRYSVHRGRHNIVDETFLCLLMYKKDIFVMNVSTESIIIIFFKKIVYLSNVIIFKYSDLYNFH